VVTLAWYHGHRALQKVSGPELTVITILLVLTVGVLWHFARQSHESSPSPVALARPPNTDYSPPPHSIAVLAFVNMSGDPKEEYFSDGLTEEILNALARINELQVSARTSSFAFKGKDLDVATIARRLNVASVLEGSVRRSGHTIRVTAQLNS